jgi:hypothetical protein
MKREDLIYLAGIIDGEGSIGISPNGASYIIKLQVYNNSLVLIKWVQKTFGGTIYTTEPKKKAHARSYTVRWLGTAAVPLLRKVKSFLKIKRKQAYLAIQTCVLQSRRRNKNRKFSTKTREFLVEANEEMHKLNRRGPNGSR